MERQADQESCDVRHGNQPDRSARNLYDQPVPFLILDDFLAPGELSALFAYTLDHEQDFSGSGVIDSGHPAGYSDTDYRRSLSLFDLGPLRNVVTSRIESSFTRMISGLQRELFPRLYIETQIVANNDGDFLKIHRDSASENLRSREITFVLYYFREPKAFEGGELRMYPSFVRETITRTRITSETIAPLQNRMVIFPSSIVHEILPIRCPSRAFADSRFSVTGWIHK